MSDLAKTQATQIQRAEGWQDVVCPRRAGPPLRFKGRLLCHHTWGSEPNTLSIDLWRRKTPGYVAALTGPDGTDAVSDRHLCGVMAWLEDLCAQSPATPDTSIETLLHRTPSAARHHQALRQLAGRALAAWDELDHTPSRKDRQ